MDRKEINTVLAVAGQGPQHRFGQNFMLDQNILRAIADSGDIHPHDILLEVGPGVGNLTRLLAQRASLGAVLAVDIDTKLMPAARSYHHALSNVTWLNADVLAGKHEINPEVIAHLRALVSAHPQGSLKLVSNLPYNAASPLIAELLVFMWADTQFTNSVASSPQHPIRFTRFAFTVQWEVAARMRAKPDTSDYGPLGILIQLMADVEIVRKIPPGAFWPPPKVHSALVVVTPAPEKIARIQNAYALQKLLAGLFSHRRQTVSNALKHYLGDAWSPALFTQITSAGITLSLRPENLALEQFLTLASLTTPLLLTPDH